MKKVLKKHPKKTVFLLLILVFIGWNTVLTYQNYQGYCKEEDRYLTDDELMSRVFEQLRSNGEPLEYFFEPYSLNNKTIYGDTNPPYYPVRVITMFFKRPEPLTSDVNYPYFIKYISINLCGKVLDSMGTAKSEEMYKSSIKSYQRQFKGE